MILDEIKSQEYLSIEDAIKNTCRAIEIDQAGISKILKAQVKRLDILAALIEKNYIFVDNSDSLIREVNSVIKSLIAYDCLIDNKLDTVSKIYHELL